MSADRWDDWAWRSGANRLPAASCVNCGRRIGTGADDSGLCTSCQIARDEYEADAERDAAEAEREIMADLRAAQ